MSWVRVDDMFWQHPKFLAISDEATALWIRALAYTNGSKTDGFVPTSALRLLSKSKRSATVARELVSVGLWESVDDGWQFHDWSEYQATKETRENATKEKTRRQQEWRERARVVASTRRHVDASTLHLGDTAPIPSHPIPSQSTIGEGAQGAHAPPMASPTAEVSQEGEPAPERAVEPSPLPSPSPSPQNATAAPKRGSNRESRCPSSVDPEAAAFCERWRLPSPASDREVGRMLDHFAAAPGQRGVKTDWAATWRIWSGRAIEFSRGGGRGPVRSVQPATPRTMMTLDEYAASPANQGDF